MKTKLLYVASFLLVFFTSCSVDEQVNEQIVEEKEIAVKKLIDAFSKSVIPSPEYSKFIEDLQTKSSSGLTAEEAAQLEQDFLSQQSVEFVELYYYVVALGLSEDQLRAIIIEYLSTVKKNFSYATKNNKDRCGIGQDQGDDSLWALIVRILCEEENRRH